MGFDNKFALISMLNEKCKVSVKTPIGETDSFLLGSIEMQGTVTAPLKCSVQIDTLGRDSLSDSDGSCLFKYYRNVLDVWLMTFSLYLLVLMIY